MSEFLDEMDAVLVELLEEFGWTATLKRPSSNGVDPTTLKAVKTYTDFPVMGVFFDPTASNLVGYENVYTKDQILSKKWMILRCRDTEVSTGDIISSVKYGDFVVDQYTAIGPSDPIYYKVASEKVKKGV